jgi:hypothetical protein
MGTFSSLRLTCVSMVRRGLDACPNFMKPLQWGRRFTVVIFWVTCPHHIHYYGVHDTSPVKKLDLVLFCVF